MKPSSAKNVALLAGLTYTLTCVLIGMLNPYVASRDWLLQAQFTPVVYLVQFMAFIVGVWTLLGLGYMGMRLAGALNGDQLPTRICAALLLPLGLVLLRLIVTALGFLHLARGWVLFLVGLVVVLASAPALTRWAKVAIGRWRPTRWSSVSSGRRTTGVVAFGSLCMMLALFAQRIAVPPADTDFLTHYAPYLLRAAHEGSAGPNEVWYQFFYSRGDSAGIALVALAGPGGKLAASLISLIAGLWILVVWLRHITGSWKLGLVASSIIALALTLGPNEIASAFAKNHLEVGSLYFALAFVLYLQLLSGLNRTRRSRFAESSSQLVVVSSVLAVGAVCLAPFTFPILLILCALVVVAEFLVSKAGSASLSVVCALSAGTLTLGAMMLWGRLATGMFEMTPFRLWIGSTDPESVSRFVSPWEIHYLAIGSGSRSLTGIADPMQTIATDPLTFAMSTLKIPYLLSGALLRSVPVLLTSSLVVSSALLLLAVSLILRKLGKSTHPVTRSMNRLLVGAIPAGALVVAYLAVTAIAEQGISAQRSSVGSIFPVILLAFATFGWWLSTVMVGVVLRRVVIAGLSVSFTLWSVVNIWMITDLQGGGAVSWRQIVREVAGKSSIAEGFDARAKRMNINVDTGLLGWCIKNVRGNTVIATDWSAELGLCNLLERGIVREVSFSLGDSYIPAIFGADSQRARQALRDFGVESIVLSGVQGALPYSKLVSSATDAYSVPGSSVVGIIPVSELGSARITTGSSERLPLDDVRMDADSTYVDLYQRMLSDIGAVNAEWSDPSFELAPVPESGGWQ